MSTLFICDLIELLIFLPIEQKHFFKAISGVVINSNVGSMFIYHIELFDIVSSLLILPINELKFFIN